MDQTKSQKFIEQHKRKLDAGRDFYNVDSALMSVADYEQAKLRVLAIFPSPSDVKSVSATKEALNDYVISHCPGVFIDFAYLPSAADMKLYDKCNQPYAIGNITHLDASHFDVVGFSISVLCEVYAAPVILNTFSRCDKPVPLTWTERKDLKLGEQPIIYAGGITAVCGDIMYGELGDGRQAFMDFTYLGESGKMDIMFKRLIEARETGKVTRSQSDHDIEGTSHKDLPNFESVVKAETNQEYIDSLFDLQNIYQPQAYEVKFNKDNQITSNKKINPKAQDFVVPYYPHKMSEDLGIGRAIVNADGDSVNNVQTQVSEGCSASGACSFAQAKGTRIWTASGIKKIEDCVGKSLEVQAIFPERCESVLKQESSIPYLVKLESGHESIADINHKFMRLKGNELEEVTTKDLRSGDIVFRKIGSDFDYEYQRDPKGNIFDEDIAELLGFMHGDGNFHTRFESTNSQMWQIYTREGEEYYQDLFKKVTKTDRVPTVVYESEKTEGVQVWFNCKSVHYDGMFTGDLALVNCDLLYVPQVVFDSPKSVMRAYLRGVFNSDGWSNDDAISITTVSKRFANDLSILLSFLGYDCSIVKNSYWENHESDYDRRVSYQVCLRKYFFEQFRKEVGFVKKQMDSDEVANYSVITLPKTKEITDSVRRIYNKRDDARNSGVGSAYELPDSKHWNISVNLLRKLESQHPEIELPFLYKLTAQNKLVPDYVKEVVEQAEEVEMYDVLNTKSHLCVYGTILTHQCAEGNYCLPAGSKIKTPDNLKSIEEFKVGDEVLLHDVSYKVTDTVVVGTKPTKLIKTVNGHLIKIADTHLMQVYENGEYVFKRAYQLKPNDLLVFETSECDSTVGIEKWLNSKLCVEELSEHRVQLFLEESVDGAMLVVQKLSTLGMFPSIMKTTPGIPKYRVYVYAGIDCRIAAIRLGAKLSKDNMYPDLNFTVPYTRDNEKEVYLVPIKSIKSGPKECMYDINVENSHAYSLFGWVSHNTGGWVEKPREQILKEAKEARRWNAGSTYKPYSFNSLLKGTRVPVGDGKFLKIEDVTPSMKVVSCHGKLSQMSDTHFGTKPVYTISTDYGVPISMTDEHRMPVLEIGGINKKFEKDLQVGDYLLLQAGYYRPQFKRDDCAYYFGQIMSDQDIKDPDRFIRMFDKGNVNLTVSFWDGFLNGRKKFVFVKEAEELAQVLTQAYMSVGRHASMQYITPFTIEFSLEGDCIIPSLYGQMIKQAWELANRNPYDTIPYFTLASCCGKLNLNNRPDFDDPFFNGKQDLTCSEFIEKYGDQEWAEDVLLGLRFAKITEISEPSEPQPVYDLIDVAEGHIFVANGYLSSNCNYITDYKGLLYELMKIYPKASFINMRMEELGRDLDALKVMKLVGANRVSAPIEGLSPRIQNQLFNKCLSEESMWNFLRYCIDLKMQDIKCLTGESIIYTENGGFRQRDIKASNVLSANGLTEMKVVSSEKRPIMKITTFRGTVIRGTYNHKVLVNPHKPFEESSYKELKDLSLSDRVYSVLGSNLFSNSLVTISIPKVHEKREHIRSVEVNDEFAEWVGWLIGDGSVEVNDHNKRVRTAYNLNEEVIAKNHIRILQAIGLPAELSRQYREDREDIFEICIGYADFARLMHSVLGSRFDGKYVPDFILQSPRSVQVSFLRGLFSADGTICDVKKSKGLETVIELGMSNQRLLQDVQSMLMNFGILSHVQTVWTKSQAQNEKHSTWILHILKHYREEFLKQIGFVGYKSEHKIIDKIEEIGNQQLSRTAHIVNGFLESRIKSIEEDGEDDIFVTKTNNSTFVADGLIHHNCGGIFSGYEEDEDFEYVCSMVHRLKDEARNRGRLIPIRFKVTPLVHYQLTALEYLERKSAKLSYEGERWLTDEWYQKFKDNEVSFKVNGFRYSTFIEQWTIDMGRAGTALAYKHIIQPTLPVYSLRSIAKPEIVQALKDSINPDTFFADRDPEHYISLSHRVHIELMGSYIPRARRLVRLKKEGRIFDNEPDIRCLKTYEGAKTMCQSKCIVKDPLKVYNDVELDEDGNLHGDYRPMIGCERCESTELKMQRLKRPIIETKTSEDLIALRRLPKVCKMRMVIERSEDYDILQPGNSCHISMSHFLQLSDELLDCFHSIELDSNYWEAEPDESYCFSGIQVIDVLFTDNKAESIMKSLVDKVNERVKTFKVIQLKKEFVEDKLKVDDRNVFRFETDLPVDFFHNAAISYKGDIKVKGRDLFEQIQDKSLIAPAVTGRGKTIGYMALPCKHNPLLFIQGLLKDKKLSLKEIQERFRFKNVMVVRESRQICKCGKEKSLISMVTGKILPYGPKCLQKALLAMELKN